MTPRRTGLLLAAAGYACWGLLAPGNKILLQELPPLWLQASRLVAAFAIVTLLMRPHHWRQVKAVWMDRTLLLAAWLGHGVAFLLFILSQTYVEATFTTLGFYTMPLWTALLGAWFLRERVGRVFWPCAAAMMVGGWWALGSPTVGSLRGEALWGVALAVGSAIVWAVYSILLRGRRVPFMPMLWVSFAIGAVWFFVLAASAEPMPAWQELSLQTWRWSVIQLVVPTLLAFAAFQAALQRAPAASVNILVGLELAGTVLLSMWLLGDQFAPLQWSGLAVATASVVLYLAIRAREDRASEPTGQLDK